MEQETQMLVERLDRLEQENSRIKRSARLTKVMLASMGALFAGVASAPLALSKPPAGVPVVNAQQFNLVNASGKVLATLGTSTDGNNLTFFDSAGKKTVVIGNSADGTFAGMATYDGNSIIPGTGQYRTTIGEANTSNVNGGGLGFGIYNSAGKLRSAGGTSVDDTLSYLDTIDPNGSTTGIIDENTVAFQNQGFFANDLNGKNRIFVGNSLDGTSYNTVQLSDAAGNFAGEIFQRPNANPSFSPGTFLLLAEPSGSFGAGEDPDGNGVGWSLVDTSSTLRMFANFDGANENIQEFSPTSVLVGHLP